MRSLFLSLPLASVTILAALAPACGGGAAPSTTSSSSGGGGGGATSSSTQSGSGGASSSSTTASGGGGAGGCGRVPGPADGPRKVVVSHPFDADGMPDTRWEVLDLDAAGTLAKTGTTLQMGRADLGAMVFTPDGQVGLVAQNDGSIGVLRFGAGGAVEVVHAGFKGSFYAGAVVIDPSGDGALVLDPDWPNNGGGLYRISIGCDGTLADLGMVTPSKLAAGLVRLGQTPDRAVLAATSVLGSAPSDNAFLLDLGGAPALVGGAPAFPDEEAIVSAVARTHDDRFALLGDNSQFASVPNRVSVVAIGAGGLMFTQTLSPVEDPVAIVTSPWDDAALVVSGFGNAILALGYDPASATAPFTVKGPLAYAGAKPQLPGSAVLIERGALRGRVYVAENLGVRQARFAQGGKVTDDGLFVVGTDTAGIVGAIGVQP